jgi:hypothetical protein
LNQATVSTTAQATADIKKIPAATSFTEKSCHTQYHPNAVAAGVFAETWFPNNSFLLHQSSIASL